MPRTDNTITLSLLREDKNEFILRCQRLIEIVVKHFIKSGLFTSIQFHDVVQSANEELIKRLPNIESNFDQRVKLTTYMSVVVRNICLRIHERELSEMDTVPLLNTDIPYEEGNSAGVVIQDEIDRLSMVLQMYGLQQSKIFICLKVYFRLPVAEEEFIKCFDKIPKEEWEPIVSIFSDDYDDSLESNNFNSLAFVMNRQESNSTSGNSLRRWTHEHLSKIISILNGNPQTRSHTKETIKILLEQYSS